MQKKIPNIIVALDHMTPDEARHFTANFGPELMPWIKIGLELFVQGGEQLVIEFKRMGFRIFLDLKLFDIPNTVSQTIHRLKNLGIDLLTVHSLGGPAMLDGAVLAAEGSSIRLLGVTLLTSVSSKDLKRLPFVALASGPSREKIVEALIDVCAQSSLAGVVCGLSDLACAPIKERVQRFGLVTVTPGIRPSFSSVEGDDQVAVGTPRMAIRSGIDHVVIGRPITQALDPQVALKLVREEFSVC